MDVHNAFLNGDLTKEVYMELPERFTRQGESKKKKDGDDIVAIFVYVDDLLITGNNQNLLCSTRSDLMKKFKMKDLEKYALELISESGLSSAKPPGTPLELNQKLTSVEYDNHFKNDSAQTNENLDNPGAYQRLIGRLLYLIMTRPDIAFVVQVLSQYMHCPKRSHMEEALRVVRHIKEAPGLGLFLPAESSDQLSAFCDSDWACIQTRRSVTGRSFLAGKLGVKIELPITLVCEQ
ncbi:uncharacterized mitochondrial protein AtMg00810-like [Nicotiana sylvestris]|uniref:uncharacterized mitochondrial protein AtMg00810-like n=1 Tax=Nicotiana sylvestris TaxID=4096 RepID=UPI00388C3C6A